MVRTSFRLSACLAAGWLAVLVAGCGSESVSPATRDADWPGEGEADASSVLPEAEVDAGLSPDVYVAADTDGDTVTPADTSVAADTDRDTAPPADTFAATDAGTVSSDAYAADLRIPPAPVTVVVLPDTQYYSSSHPDIFAAQTRWIVEQKPARNVAAVLHVGDLVDGPGDPAQWTVANSSMRLLDKALVPYVIVPGNHDTDNNRGGPIDNYFAPTTMPWITGTMTAGQIENNYALVDIGPQKWLVMGLEFGPRDTVLTWADGVLKAYPALPTIIVTHAYLYGDGTRYNYALYGSAQAWYPRYYLFTPNEGINDGEDIWQKLIVPNPNVRLVFCGHDNGAARLTSLRADGSPVHQMLSDYQWADSLGGSGYLRVLEFDYGKKEIRVQTYSPYLDLFMTDDANQFTLSLER
jgi:hypothetical protein